LNANLSVTFSNLNKEIPLKKVIHSLCDRLQEMYAEILCIS